MADWRERAWDRFIKCDGFTVGADMSHSLVKKHEDFIRIIAEESAPVIAALKAEVERLKQENERLEGQIIGLKQNWGKGEEADND